MVGTYNLGDRLLPNMKLQVRCTSNDKLLWEGYVSEVKADTFHGSTCGIDFLKPSGTPGEKFDEPDFTVYIHFDDEYPQTILSKKTIERLYPWDTESKLYGVVTGYGDLKNEPW